MARQAPWRLTGVIYKTVNELGKHNLGWLRYPKQTATMGVRATFIIVFRGV